MIQQFKQGEAVKKAKMIKELSNDRSEMEGMLSVSDLKRKAEKDLKVNQVQEYVNHFSHVADYFSVENRYGKHNIGFDFGRILKQKVDSNIKQFNADEIERKMKEMEKKRVQYGMTL